VHGDDNGFSRLFAEALVGVGRAGIEVNGIADLKSGLLIAVMETELAVK
jgi:hypothetical protein